MNPYDKFLSPEDKLHIACCDYLDLQYPKLLYTHPANEGKRTKFEQYKVKKMRMKPGVPDLLIFEPKGQLCGLGIEFKIGKNKTTANQKYWLSALFKKNWQIITCYDFEGFKSSIDWFTALP